MADWSTLPLDLVCSITDKLDTVDCIRFGCVCAPWRAAVREKVPRRHPQAPWLLMLLGGKEGDDRPNTLNFFSLSDSVVYKIDLPDPPIRRRLVIGSGEGWLVTADEMCNVHLLNPFTKVQVALPSITTLPTVSGAVYDSEDRVTHYLYGDIDVEHEPVPWEEMRECIFVKAVLSSNPVISSTPSSPSDWTVVLTFNPIRRLAFARAGEQAWTYLDALGYVEDVIYHDGLFYALERTLATHTTLRAWDLRGPAPRFTLIEPPLTFSFSYKYLVVSGEDLLQVWRHCDLLNEEGEEEDYRTVAFQVFRLDESKNNWIELKSLGDHALFLGINHSKCLSTVDFPELKRNYIYFTEDNWDAIYAYIGADRDIGACNFEDGSIESCYPYNDLLNWIPPVWFTPSLY